MRNFLRIGILLLMSTFTLQAQQGWEAGFWGGGSWYFGDLNTSLDLSKPGLAGGAVMRYNFNERVCFKMSANIGKVSGDDADSRNIFEQARNLSFQSRVMDGAAELEFNFLNYEHGSKDAWFTPYLSGGLMIHNFNPQTEYEGNLVDLQPLGTEGQFIGEEYKLTKLGLAYGGGFKMSLSYEWSLDVFVSARKLFTDYLDDVSTVYADPEDIAQFHDELGAELSDRSIDILNVSAAEISAPGRQRGDSSTNDSYAYAGITLLYYFGDLRCPTYGSRKRRK